jgi:hypothetical protein
VYLIQILLPLYDNNKQYLSRKLYDDIRNQLKDKFGGVTFYRHSPAEGLWKDEGGETNYDEVIIAEVMTDKLEKDWWQQYKDNLEKFFKQDEVVIRVSEFQKL